MGGTGSQKKTQNKKEDADEITAKPRGNHE